MTRTGLLTKAAVIPMLIGAITTGCTSTENQNTTAKVATYADDGTQMQHAFRLNYAGYLPLQEKIAVYIAPNNGEAAWKIVDSEGNTAFEGTSSTYVANDHASGDSFYRIDFSDLATEGQGYSLVINDQHSAPFAITNDPYGALKYEFFDYFKDHRRSGDVFDRAIDDWTQHSVSFNFIADAGDQGYYTVNAAEAQWSLIHLLETYPEINEYYNKHNADMATVYEELVFFNDPMDKVIFPGQTLAVGKLHTNSNDTWAKCPGAPGKEGACISHPETKATYSVARTLAAMSRLHHRYGDKALTEKHYNDAVTALTNAETTPYTCLTWAAFGGEGGYYPNNDNWSLWRDPQNDRDPCASSKKADPKDNNINDDHYAALTELYLAAIQLGKADEAESLKKKVVAHPHFQRVDYFFFGAVSTEANLSLLTANPKSLNLAKLKENVFTYADKVIGYQAEGYPGITFDVDSEYWNSDDQNEVDNNFRWGSNRMQLNDARIVMTAARLAHEKGDAQRAAKYTNAVLRVLDQISGTNGVALAMYTAADYKNIEHAVTRTHDVLVEDTVSGKMVLGPNNWTNANDPAMPEFGSQPGMKMFALTGTGWSSREIAIDANAALVPVVYFATEIAPGYLEAAKAK